MKNKVTDLNNLLFDQMERLRDASTKELSREVERTDSMIDISKQIISAQTMALDAAKLRAEYMHRPEKDVLPEAFIANDTVPPARRIPKIVQ